MIRANNNKSLFFLCILLTPLINIGLDIYTPSLPALTNTFQTTHYAVNLTLLIYTISFGITQPIIGPSCDRIGRKPFIWLALFIYLSASVAASLSWNIYALCFFRIGQGAGAAIIAACIKAILVDCYDGKQLAQSNSYFSLAWSLTPIIAPAIGGYLQHYLNWESIFYCMALYAFICMIFCRRYLVETRSKTAMQTQSHHMLASWAALCSNRVYLTSSLILTIQFVIILLYYLSAPYVLQNQLHLNAAQYGHIMLLLGCAYFVGNLVNQFLLNHLTINTIVLTGLSLSVIISSAMAITLHNTTPTIITATLPIFWLFFCDGLIFANVLTQALSANKQFPATAGALLGGILNIVGSSTTFLINHFINLHNLFLLSLVYCAILVLALLLFFPAMGKSLDKNSTNA